MLQKLRSPLFLVTAQLLLIKWLAVVAECECERRAARPESASLLQPPSLRLTFPHLPRRCPLSASFQSLKGLISIFPFTLIYPAVRRLWRRRTQCLAACGFT